MSETAARLLTLPFCRAAPATTLHGCILQMSTHSLEGLLFTTMPGASPTLSLTPKKQAASKKIAEDTKDFLARGGTITQLSKAESAWDEKAVKFMPTKMRGNKCEQDAPDS